jgi:serine/threonine protein kinase
MESNKLSIFLNKNLKKSCELNFHSSLSVKEIISQSSQLMNIKPKNTFKLFDSTGGEMSDEDIELINPHEPLFLSQGENFQKECSLSIYDEVKLLGQGGFGLVKLYKNKLTDELFALKFVEYNSLANTEDVGRMYNEIALLRGLRHSNIVQLIDAFDLKDRMCFVMEYCSGGELNDYITQKAPLCESDVISLSVQIVEAVRYCHNCKVIHRDLKPENVLFSNESRNSIKIVDFGISGMFVAGKAEVSEAGSLLYTAPEVITRKDLRAAPALDVWSIGCIIYLMLTNNHPFMGKNQQQVINNIVSGKYPKLPKTVPEHWKKFFYKVFKVNPLQRWSILDISSFFDKLRFGDDSCSSDSYESEADDFVNVEEVKSSSFKQGNKVAPVLSHTKTVG